MTEPTVGDLLNSLGIVGPNIRHALRLSSDKMAALDIAYIDNECVCGRIWPCEALALAQAVDRLEAEARQQERAEGLDAERLRIAFANACADGYEHTPNLWTTVAAEYERLSRDREAR